MAKAKSSKSKIDREAIGTFLATLIEIVEVTEGLFQLGASIEQLEDEIGVSPDFPFQVLGKYADTFRGLCQQCEVAFLGADLECDAAVMDILVLEHQVKCLMAVPEDGREIHLNMGFYTLAATAKRIQEGISRLLAGTEFDPDPMEKAA